jgi:hypothetical protein
MGTTMTAIRINEALGFPTPGTNECGLAWTGEGFWHYDAKTELLYKLSIVGDIQDSFTIPNAGCDTEFDGTSIWQASPNELKIHQLDPSTGAIRKSLTTTDKCSGLCTDGLNWFRGSWVRKSVIRFDQYSGEELEEIPTGATTSGLTSDGRFLWHAGESDNQEYLFCIDPESGRLIDQYPIDASICGLTYDGKRLWAACNRRHKIIPIEIE